MEEALKRFVPNGGNVGYFPRGELPRPYYSQRDLIDLTLLLLYTQPQLPATLEELPQTHGRHYFNFKININRNL